MKYYNLRWFPGEVSRWDLHSSMVKFPWQVPGGRLAPSVTVDDVNRIFLLGGRS